MSYCEWMTTADANSVVDNGSLRDSIAAAVRGRRESMDMTQKRFARWLGNGTSVDAIKKVESGSRGAPLTSDAPSYLELCRRFPEVKEFVDLLPSMSDSRRTALSLLPLKDSTAEVPLLPGAHLTEQMVSIVSSPSLVCAFISANSQEFKPQSEQIAGRVIGDDTLEVHAPLFDWSLDDNQQHFGLRWRCCGGGYLGGCVLSPMGIEIGRSILELSDQRPGFSGITMTLWKRHGFAIHILGLAASESHALQCVQVVWDDLATPTGNLLGSGRHLTSLRSYTAPMAGESASEGGAI